MAKAKDWTSEGCGLTWTISGDTAEWYRRTMLVNGYRNPPRYMGQSAPSETGQFLIGGTERITLSHEHGASFRQIELGAYQSHAEARIAAAAFAYGDASVRYASAIEDAGYVLSRHAGGRTTYSKVDGAHDVSIAIGWPPEGGEGRMPGLFLQATIRGRGKRDLHTATIQLPREDSNLFTDGSPWTGAEILSLAVQATLAVTEARLKGRGGRSRSKPLATGEEAAFIASMLRDVA